MHGTTKLRTDRLTLRKYRPEDAEALYLELGKDEAMYEFSGWNPYATLEMARETVSRFIDSYGDPHSYSWVMDSENVFLGTIGAYDYHDDQIELGLSVVRKAWGRGYATEALKAVLDYLTEDEGILCVTAWCASDNIGSKRAMEKAGMKFIHTEMGGLSIGDRLYNKMIFEFRKEA